MTGDSTLLSGTENVEGFEFANSDWTAEFQASRAAIEGRVQIPSFESFERVFAASAQKAPSSWTSDFKSFNLQQELKPVELENFNQIFSRLEKDRESLQKEFEKFEIKSAPQSSEWIEEFNAQETSHADDDLETAQSARNLLESLDLSDEKLARSKFVAYLRELAETDPCLNGTFEAEKGFAEYDWNSEYLSAMHSAGLDQDPQDVEWRRFDKAWDEYEFNGLGYEGFAPRQFSAYRFVADNPFSGYSLEALRQALHGKDLKDTILVLEALCKLSTDDAGNWIKLGQAQAENEIDVQAIAAFYQATQIEPANESALVGLAASCVNEFCVPDALEALEKIAKNHGLDILGNNDRLNHLIGLYQNSSFFSNELTRVMALSILYNLADEPEKAAAVLQNRLEVTRKDV